MKKGVLEVKDILSQDEPRGRGRTREGERIEKVLAELQKIVKSSKNDQARVAALRTMASVVKPKDRDVDLERMSLEERCEKLEEMRWLFEALGYELVGREEEGGGE